MANPDKIRNIQLFRLISEIPPCCFVRNTIPHAMSNTTHVRTAVARFDPTPSMPTFAKIEVNAANTADNNAKINHILIFPFLRNRKTLRRIETCQILPTGFKRQRFYRSFKTLYCSFVLSFASRTGSSGNTRVCSLTAKEAGKHC